MADDQDKALLLEFCEWLRRNPTGCTPNEESVCIFLAVGRPQATPCPHCHGDFYPDGGEQAMGVMTCPVCHGVTRPPDESAVDDYVPPALSMREILRVTASDGCAPPNEPSSFGPFNLKFQSD